MNIEDFPRCLVLDRWAGNCDGRQATFSRSSLYLGYKVRFIDQGYCFNAGEWTFPDLALQGVYYRNYVYQQVTGWESFEPTHSRAEQADAEGLWEIAEGMPEEWWNQKFPPELTRLIETFYKRRSTIRDLITAFHESSRNPFPNWKSQPLVSVPANGRRFQRVPRIARHSLRANPLMREALPRLKNFRGALAASYSPG